VKITILTIGKRHEPWVEPGIKRFLERLRAPFVAEMIITIPHSGQIGDRARQDESERLMSRLKPHDFIILLDERGRNLSSPELSRLILDHTDQHIVIIIGGAYGVTETLHRRADIVWSLSRLVFPHQLVRLILAEQLYRAQEIARGGAYHHD
jgi:ribosomal RNA large subunit methyltransferase H